MGAGRRWHQAWSLPHTTVYRGSKKPFQEGQISSSNISGYELLTRRFVSLGVRARRWLGMTCFHLSEGLDPEGTTMYSKLLQIRVRSSLDTGLGTIEILKL